MAANVTYNDKLLQKKVRVTTKRYSPLIYKAITQWLDKTRRAAAREIIPNTVGKKKTPWRMAKEQATTPGRITERTGRYTEMVEDSAKWTYGRTIVKQNTMALAGLVRRGMKSKGRGTDYIGQYKVNISPDNKFIGRGFVGKRSRIQAVVDGKVVASDKRTDTKQTLAMRFKHETGIRGSVRAIFKPAANKTKSSAAALVKRQLKEVTKIWK